MAQMSKISTVKMLIGGEFVDSTTTEWQEVRNPATQEVLAHTPCASSDEIERAIRGAQKAFESWREVPVPERARLMFRYQDLLKKHQIYLKSTSYSIFPRKIPILH